MTRRVRILCGLVTLFAAFGCGTDPSQTIAPTPIPPPPLPGPPDFSVTPISAVFRPDLFKTIYSATVRSSSVDRFTVIATWGGPLCGTKRPSEPQSTSVGGGNEVSVSMEWEHPHPPCGNDPTHRDTLITLSVRNSLPPVVTINCLYVGAASETGPPCARQP